MDQEQVFQSEYHGHHIWIKKVVMSEYPNENIQKEWYCGYVDVDHLDAAYEWLNALGGITFSGKISDVIAVPFPNKVNKDTDAIGFDTNHYGMEHISLNTVIESAKGLINQIEEMEKQ